ncbi:MAG: cyclic lactone autoinducer peptide [Eubacteriales bacterium]
MKNIKMISIVRKMGTMVAMIAMFVTATNVNAACAWVMNQPELPETAKKLRKF